MQNEITRDIELLNDRGLITEEGYARHPHWRYRRDRIRAPWWRIKEWDYYAVIDQERGAGVTLTFSDLGYVGLFAVCFVDIREGLYKQIDTLKPLPRGKMSLREDIDEPHELVFEDKKVMMRLVRETDRRRLEFRAGRIEGEISLQQASNQERMVIATSWSEKRSAFYYNQKINCMPAEGRMTAEGEDFTFRPETSFGVLDWGRGNWTYRNRWYWGSASGMLEVGTKGAAGAQNGASKGAASRGPNKVPFGFNLGYGFSDRSSASENMLFYDGRAHKLEEVVFEFDPEHIMEPWRIRDSDGRLDLVFRPRVDRRSNTNLLLVKSVQDQVFGYFSGTAVLDDGTKLDLAEFPGFFEDVYNRW